MENSVENMKSDWLTLLFTCNGVGVVIRSVRLYDLVKTAF